MTAVVAEAAVLMLPDTTLLMMDTIPAVPKIATVPTPTASAVEYE